MPKIFTTEKREKIILDPAAPKLSTLSSWSNHTGESDC